MVYNYNFSLGSILFLGLTAAFYLRQRRMRDLQDRLYTVMLCGGLLAVIFDFVSALCDGGDLPLTLHYACNMLFILGEHICLPAFFFFTVSASERYSSLSRATKALALLPFAVVVGLLALSPFGTGGIFYLDSQQVYRAGATHWTLYASAAVYIVAACATLARNYRVIGRTKLIFVIVFGLVIISAMLTQIYYPQYLLTTAATALALTAMYYLMLAPGEQVDPFTGAFCRPVLPAVLKDLADKNKRCTLVLYSLLNYRGIVNTHGPRLSDALLVAMSDWLRDAFPGDVVVYMNGAKFAVIVDSVLDARALTALRRQAPTELMAENCQIPVGLTLAALVHDEDSPLEKSLNAMDFLFRQMEEEQREEVFVAGAAFREKCSRLVRLEASMARIAREGTPFLLLEPVRRAAEPPASSPAVLDLSLGLLHQELRDVSPEELHFAVKQSGHIRWYYQQLTALAGEQAATVAPGVRFCLPLFSSVLIQDEMATRLFDLVTAAGLDPRRIVFRFAEKDVDSELPVVTDNIRRMAAFGFSFRLDGFAHGHTDMSLLSKLPISAVMIDASLLRQARTNERSRALLVCVVSILSQAGKEVVCAGVDSPLEAEIARSAGVRLYHGQLSLTEARGENN